MKEVVLVVLGAILTLATQRWDEWRRFRRHRRAALVKLWQILEHVLISVELSAAWRDAGGIESYSEMFDIPVPWKKSAPPPPPSIPSGFDEVAESIVEWEAQRGSYKLSKSVGILKQQLEGLQRLHTMIDEVAKKTDGEGVTERVLKIYDFHQSSMKETLQGLLRDVAARRRPLHKRLTRTATYKQTASRLAAIVRDFQRRLATKN